MKGHRLKSDEFPPEVAQALAVLHDSGAITFSGVDEIKVNPVVVESMLASVMVFHVLEGIDYALDLARKNTKEYIIYSLLMAVLTEAERETGKEVPEELYSYLYLALEYVISPFMERLVEHCRCFFREIAKHRNKKKMKKLEA